MHRFYRMALFSLYLWKILNL